MPLRAPDFWHDPAALPGKLLAPLGCLYQAVESAYMQRTKPTHPGVPVICIGNLVAGGAGKTPVALDIGARLCQRGIQVHFLSRGYGGLKEGPLQVDPEKHSYVDVGDEPLLLARAAPTWVARKRLQAARRAVEAGAEALVMDDGFQNPHVAKDLSLVVIDGVYGFGNNRVLPAGPMRETAQSGMARADAVVIMGEDRCGLTARLAPYGKPVLHAQLAPPEGTAAQPGQPVFAFAGIGRPEKFFTAVQAQGYQLAGTRAFSDHHPFTLDEMQSLLVEAERLGAQPVTTAKDAMRLPPAVLDAVTVLEISVQWADPAALDVLLAQVIDGRAG